MSAEPLMKWVKQFDHRGPLGSVSAEDVLMAPKARSIHAHDTLHLCAVLAGGMEQRVAGRWNSLTENTIRISPPGEKADLRFSGMGARCFVVEYSGLEPEDSLWLNPKAPVFIVNRASAALMRKVLDGFHTSTDGAEDPLFFESALLELFAFARQMDEGRASPPPRWLYRTRDWLHAQYKTPLRLAEAALTAQVTPVHLSREFRRQFGCSMGDYLRALRISHAQRLLASSSLSLRDVALASGFYDQSHFTRLFKAKVGVTPRAYRKMSLR